jgi:hypothetical protein
LVGIVSSRFIRSRFTLRLITIILDHEHASLRRIGMLFQLLIVFLSTNFVSCSYVSLNGNFKISDTGTTINEIQIATTVSRCTADILIKYRRYSSAELVQGFLTRNLLIIQKSHEIACPSYKETFAFNTQFAIQRVAKYVYIQYFLPTKTTTTSTRPIAACMAETDTVHSVTTSLTTTSTIQSSSISSSQSPILSSSSSPSLTENCERRTTVDFRYLFDEVNDYVLAAIVAGVTSICMSIRSLYSILTRVCVAALNKSKERDVEKQQDNQSESNLFRAFITSLNRNVRNDEKKRDNQSSSSINVNYISDIRDSAAKATASNQSQSTLTTINETQSPRKTRQNTTYTSLYNGNLTTSTVQSTIFCKCVSGTCKNCKCAVAGVACGILCHKSVFLTCQNPHNSKIISAN